MIATRNVADDVLARRAGEGDDDAFTTLFERHVDALYRYCRSIVSHDQDAQDAVQNTMVSALASLRKQPLEAPLRPWLFRIGHNESISLLRRRRPTDSLDAQFDLAGAPIESTVRDRERMASLVADLRELPERQRSALVMRELSGLSHEEISVALAIPVSATKQAIFDARRGLLAAEEGRQMDCEPVQRAISDGDGRVLRARHMRAHVRGCPSCSAMRDAIGTREKDLAALIPPLPAFAASALLEQALEGATLGAGAVATGLGVAGGGAGAGAVAGTAAAVAGKSGPIAGLVISGKALAITAAVLTAAGTATYVAERPSAPPSPPASASSAATAASPTTMASVALTSGGGVFSTSGAGRGLAAPGAATAGPTAAPGGSGSSSSPSSSGAPSASAPGTPGAETAAPGVGAPPAGVKLPDPAGGSSSGGSSGGSSSGSSGSSTSPVDKTVASVKEAPAKVVAQTKQTVGAATGAAGNTVTTVVQSTTQAVEQTTSQATEAAGDTVNKVVDTVKGTADKAVDTVTDVAGKVTDLLTKRPK